MVFALLAAQCVCAERYYVRQTAPGANDGSNWSHAFTSLTLALDVASPSDEIWMAEGTYRPTSDGDRGKSFSVPNSTLIFGGFAGTEDSRHQRDWRAHPTILTGDIGVHNDRTDNSYHVVRTQNDATLDGLIIEGGYADGADSDGWGGGAFLEADSGATIINCVFRNNYGVLGGGLYSRQAPPTVFQSIFYANEADSGAAIYVEENNPILRFCNFYGNQAATQGGAVTGGAGTRPQLAGCIVWGNTPDSLVSALSDVQHSIIEGGWSGTNVLDADPLFVDPADGDFTLQLDSPAIDAGVDSNLLRDTLDYDGDGDVAELFSLDFHKGPRRVNLTERANTGTGVPVDIGAVEFPGYHGFGDRVWLDINRDGLQSVGEPGLEGVRVNMYDVTGLELLDVTDTDEDGHYQFGQNLNLGTHVIEFVLATNRFLTVANAGDDNLDSDPDPATGRAFAHRLEHFGTASVDAGVLSGVVYVNQAAAAGGDGTSWENAFTTLGAGLAVAEFGDEIWIAGGTYTPGSAPSDTFVIPERVILLGGFAGTENTRFDRVPSAQATILSGNLGGASATHLLVASGEASFDALILDRASALGGGDNALGAAVFAQDAALTFTDCVFSNHIATSGAAVHSTDSTLTFFQCYFYGNGAVTGGVVYLDGGSATFLQSTITGNTSGDQSAALAAVSGGAFTLTGTVLHGNGTALQAANATVSYSLIEGGWPGAGNVDEPYQFVDLAAQNFRPLPTSLAVDSGDASALFLDFYDRDGDFDFEEPWPLDLDGNPRRIDLQAVLDVGLGGNPAIDIGAFEVPGFTGIGGRIWSDVDGDGFQDLDEPSASGVRINLFQDGAVPIATTVTGSDGRYVFEGLVASLYEVELQLPSNRQLTVIDSDLDDRFDSNFHAATGRVSLQLREKQASLNVDGGLTPGVLFAVVGGSGQGTSWADAADLATALELAVAQDEIWVAAGEHVVPGARDEGFVVPADVSLYGGFAGDESERRKRNWGEHATVLTGEREVGGPVDNSYRIVTLADRTVLDGFLIEDANNGDAPDDMHAAIVVAQAENVRLANLVVRHNNGVTPALRIHDASPSIFQCAFVDNAGTQVGAIAISGSSSPEFVSCLLANNAAIVSGGFVAAGDSTPVFHNSIIWGNTPTNLSGPTAEIHNSIVEGGWSGAGSSILSDDPQFADAGAEDYQSVLASPGIDVGDISVIPLDVDDLDEDGDSTEPYPLDLQGGTRVVKPVFRGLESAAVDIGPYEYAGGVIGDYVWLDLNANGQQDPEEPPAPGVSVSIVDSVGQELGSTVTDAQGAYLFSGLLAGTYGLTFTAPPLRRFTVRNVGDDSSDSDVGEDGTVTVSLAAEQSQLTIDAALLPRRIHVKPDGVGPGGATWDFAVDLHTALSQAASGDEIWLLSGTYPTSSGSDRAAHFSVPAEVSLIGGFVGTELSPQHHTTPPLAPSVLTAELGAAVAEDNSYHVLRMAGGSSVEWLTIEGGYANGSGDDRAGGGIILEGQCEVRNCEIRNNFAATHGGGLHGVETTLTLDSVLVEGNGVGSTGGGIYLQEGTVILTDAILRENTAGVGGGGISMSGTDLTIQASTFTQNSTPLFGGGIWATDGILALTETDFSGNSAGLSGGALDVRSSQLSMSSCDLRSNGSGLRGVSSEIVLRSCVVEDHTGPGISAQNGSLAGALLTVTGNSGGGLRLDTVDTTLVNCTIAQNQAGTGAGVFLRGQGTSTLTNCAIVANTASERGGGLLGEDGPALTMSFCTVAGNEAPIGAGVDTSALQTPQFTACILAGNVGQDLVGPGATLVNCLTLQNWEGAGSANVVGDPLFEAPQTLEFRLQFESPGVDAADSALLPSDIFDLDGDENVAESIPWDLAGDDRRQDSPGVDTGVGSIPRPDIGAFESGPGGAIGDFVWFDTNRDGRQDDTEKGLEDVTVTLLSEGGGEIASVQSGANGSYSFSTLAGNYILTVTPPAFFTVSPTSSGSSAENNDLEASGRTALFSLAPGQTRTDIDLGLSPVSNAEAFDFELHHGWNLVASPLRPVNDPLPGLISLGAWAWDGLDWAAVQRLTERQGVFIFNPIGPQAATTLGAPIFVGTALPTGWNLFGPGSSPPYTDVPLSEVVLNSAAISSPIWCWTGTSYEPVIGPLRPGRGYWAYVGEPE